MNRFVQLASSPSRNRNSPNEALISTVCLWGSHLSRNPSVKRHEAGFLTKAIRDVSGSLFLTNTGQHGHAILGIIQAEVLLANYFFSLGRFLEGKYHSSAATSLAITCRLNALGSVPDAGMLGMNLITQPYPGFPTADAGDAIDHGERINAFWAVYILDKCWSVALSSPSSISENITSGLRITTPWPLSMAQYQQVSSAVSASDDMAC